MLKKIVNIFLFFIVFNFIYSQEVTLTKIETTTLKGNAYFPLFIGAKWTWTLEMFGSKNRFSWEITEAYEITDSKNNLDHVIGFKTICKEIGSEWYFIEENGYISFYEKVDSNYEIQRIIPINPKIGDKWKENFRINTVSTITDEFIKIDTETEDKKTIGYKIFRKDIGLFDLYEIEKKEGETIYTKWTLNEYNKYGDILKKEEVLTKKEDDKNNKIIKEEKNNFSESKSESNKETKDISENYIVNFNAIDEKKEEDYSKYLIKELSKNKSYIQIGSFSTINNALKILTKSMTYNYNTFIYLEKDNYYKVLIEIDKDEEKSIQFIRKNIEEKAFFKQRKNK